MFEKIRNKMFKRNMESYEINMDELINKQNQGAIIVDVRSSQEYNEGHLLEAINIPYYEIKKTVNNIIKDKAQEIVVYCQEGVRSKQAYKILKKLKYDNVFSLYKGLDNWF
ncbi:MAG: rhodanese-like domain-containing protein [Clostridia bacterium]|nr:rhodanese-like domain-containing protein [Clostridia bacterium]